MTERRVKIFCIEEDDLLAVLMGRFVIDPASFPEGAKIDRCWYDYPTRSISVMVAHPSFEEIQTNMVPPRVMGVSILQKAHPPFISSFPEEGEGR